MFLFMIYTSALVSLLLVLITFQLSEKKEKMNEKSSAYECGFNPISSARSMFSLQFFLILILFLIFDVEISLLAPIVLIQMKSQLLSSSIILFVFVISLGLIFEWFKGSLNWLV